MHNIYSEFYVSWSRLPVSSIVYDFLRPRNTIPFVSEAQSTPDEDLLEHNARSSSHSQKLLSGLP